MIDISHIIPLNTFAHLALIAIVAISVWRAKRDN